MLKIYGKENCTFCQRAKSLVEDYNIPYEYIDVEKENLVDWIKAQGFTTVPQIWESHDHDSHIGGFDELLMWMADRM